MNTNQQRRQTTAAAEAARNMTPDDVAKECLERLSQSERGQGAILALSKLLWNHSTWSLDAQNQQRLVCVLALSLREPSVRERVQQEGHQISVRSEQREQHELGIPRH
jgi:hypothetical protein